MSDATTSDAGRLFRASCIALIVTSMSFALRADAGNSWTSEFGLTHEQVGWVNGAAFWGFLLAMVLGGPLCDWLGLGRIVGLAFVGHVAGIVLTFVSWNFTSLLTGTLVFGVANGAVEAACNPLIATIYRNDKTTMLNRFHAWFPGGIVLGGLLAFFAGKFGLGWRGQFALLLLPTALYGWMMFRQVFPATERVQQGVSDRGMFAACVRPGFLVLVLCMFLSAATELGPQQWIPNILSHAGVPGILVLVWITGLMAIGRLFAGFFVHRLSPPGVLLGSSILSMLGLLLLARAEGAMLFGAATVFALGVCFFWPTMLGYASEAHPRTGALGLAIIGGAGVLSTSIILPVIGRAYDSGVAARLPEGTPGSALPPEEWVAIQAASGLETLGRVAVLPAILAVIFLALLLVRRRSATA